MAFARLSMVAVAPRGLAWCRVPLWPAVLVAGALFLSRGSSWATAAGPGHGVHNAGALELDVKSEFSHIRIRRQGNIRAMLFVRDKGEEVEESALNLKKPYEMVTAYCRFMFASYLFRPDQERVLIVGLGGGAMIHFLKHYDPELKADAVEIDPAVVKIADRYFGVRSGGNVNIITEDAFQYLAQTEARYDVIYMDAFLKPAADTDATGLPLRLKTEKFYRSVQEKLKPDGLVVFNLNRHKETETDVSTIQNAFRHVYAFRPPSGNVVVMASTAEARLTSAELHARAKQADHRFKATFSFQDLLGRLRDK